MSKWTADNLPNLDGKIAIVTGANSGIGFEASAELAGKGATVIMACRNLDKANKAADDIRGRYPSAQLEVMQLDLSDLESVKRFADEFKASHSQLHMLCNNGGIMGGPEISHTKQGFELMFGTNHLGHFALVGHLLEVLEATPASRVVAVSSMAHRNIKGLNLDDPNFETTEYGIFDAYAKSKLANLTFCLELDKRLKATGIDACGAIAHPGYTATNITSGSNPDGNWLKDLAVKLGDLVLAMPAHKGALPTLYAAADPSIQGGEYIGPDGPFQFMGSPARVAYKETADDPVARQRLWEISEELTGIRYLS